MSRGHDRERAVRDWLRDRDWLVVRAAGSLGVADLIALKQGERPWLVEVKSDAESPYENFRPADRERLRTAAKMSGAEAWLAWWPPRGTLKWISEAEWPGASSKTKADAA